MGHPKIFAAPPRPGVGLRGESNHYRVKANLACTRNTRENEIRPMADKTYLVRLKPPQRDAYCVIAERVETQGEHLVFLNAQGKLLVLILLEIVEGWTETEIA